MDALKITFVATGDIAVPLLKALNGDSRFQVARVITAPDKPAGRGMKLKPSAIKTAAEQQGIPVTQPEDIENELEEIRKSGPDFLLVMAYGQILSPALLKAPRIAPVNVHVSLLPKHRGASPVQSALLAGDAETGVSVMKMETKMDAGPVYDLFPVVIRPIDNTLTLTEKLANEAAEKTPDLLMKIARQALKPVPQNHAEATLCPKIRKEDGVLDWTKPAEILARQIRAYTGWPGTHTFWEGKRLKILSAKAVPKTGEPGRIWKDGKAILAGANQGALELERIQIEGKSPQHPSEFIKGYPDFINSKLSATP